jgi:preprotein translocase subunit Sec61beta
MERLKEKTDKENMDNQKISPRMALALLMIVAGMIIILLSFIY